MPKKNLINNAGVFGTADPTTPDGLDIRFTVNTIAPHLLTKWLLPLIESSGRVINLSSAAQAPVDPDALLGRIKLSDGMAYAQSKLAITMRSHHMALSLKDDGPAGGHTKGAAVVIDYNYGIIDGTKVRFQGEKNNASDDNQKFW